jgi:hypothetical protein
MPDMEGLHIRHISHIGHMYAGGPPTGTVSADSLTRTITARARWCHIWNPIHLVHVGTYRYVPTCTDLYYDIVCTGTYYLRNVA